MSNYVVVGRFNEITFEELVSKKLTKRLESLTGDGKISKKMIKTSVAIALGIVFTVVIGDISFASAAVNPGDVVDAMTAPSGTGYREPVQLQAIIKFIDWMIFIVRWVVSSIIGLIATYAGYTWATDISGSGVAEAKKILKNAAWGVLWVQFGAIVANYFVDKMQSFL